VTDADLFAVIDSPGRRAEVSCRELVEAFLSRIGRYQPALGALITVTPDLALAGAAAADLARGRGEATPLDGMPLVLKDNIDVAGVRTTVGSKIFEDLVADRDAELVRKLRAAGAVILGKANLHELVFGGTTNNVFYGTCRNPWDLERIPGGSSGGCGAALAADLCLAAIGSDTGGSIRLPAAITGVSGLRPSYGLVSTRGVFPVCPLLDTAGPMARSALDLAGVLQVIAGYDPLDPWAVSGIDPKLGGLESSVEGLRIGVVESPYFWDGMDPGIERVLRAAIEELAAKKVTLSRLEVPGLEEANEAGQMLVRTEALALHRRVYEEQPHLLSQDTRRRLSLAEKVSGVDFADLLRFMRRWQWDLRRVFDDVELVLSPMLPFVAPRIADTEMLTTTATVARSTYPWSVAHLTALSLPCGRYAGLPVGLQLAGPAGAEGLLLRVAAAYQSTTGWHRERPVIGHGIPAGDASRASRDSRAV
jgi:aspartyl-tRNA(Asn)/glutamyl-tRNA(Gln) amidotransferase subunit A